MTKEDKLVSRLKSGESGAVREWFELYQAKLKKLVVSKVSVESDAEELVQEIFINCLKHLNLFRGDSSIWTWMSSIARHEIADYYRKKYAKKALRTLPLTSAIFGGVNVVGSHEVSQELSEEVSGAVHAVLEKMSPERRELLLSKYVDGKRVKALAEEMGRSVKSVESELFRSREEFRLLWETHGD